MEIAGSVALVTGGASGLGHATVRELHRQGASVVILDLAASRGEELAGELGGRVVFAPGDVTSADDVIAALNAAERLGTLRITVNCAGIGHSQRTVGREDICGTAWINTHLALAPYQPFGGAKWSGIGVENGPWGLNAFTERPVLHQARKQEWQ